MCGVDTTDSTVDRWYRVDKRLLPIKVLYFLVFAAKGCLMPYLAPYINQLGFTSSEVGAMISITKLFIFFAQPLAGVLADKFQKHKVVLVTSYTLWELFSVLMLVISTRNTSVNPDMIRTDIICGSKSYVRQCEDIKAMAWPESSCSDGTAGLFGVSAMNNTGSKTQGTCSLLCKTPVLDTSQKCFSTVSNEHAERKRKCFGGVTDFEKNIPLEFFEQDRMSTDSAGRTDYLQNNSCTCFHLGDFLHKGVLAHDLFCENFTTLNCDLLCEMSPQNSHHNSSANYSSFWIFAMLLLIFSVMQMNTESMINSIAYSILGKAKNAWGKQRMYGSIGYMLCAVMAAFIMDAVKKSQVKVDYSVMFYAFEGLCALGILACFTLKVSIDVRSSQFLTDIRKLITNGKIIVFLITMFCFGMMTAVVDIFKYLFLQELGAEQIVFGMCVVSGCSAEVLMLFVSGNIIKKFGHVSCLLAASLAYAIRLVGFSFITNAWFILALEPLHGVTYGLLHAASTSYMNLITPKELVATAQGLLHGVYFALGIGAGSVVTGVLFDEIGARWTFRAYSAFAVVVLCFYASSDRFCLQHKQGNHAKTDVSVPDTTANTDLLTRTRQIQKV